MRLIEGVFPDYRQVIPKIGEKCFKIGRERFLDTLRRVSLLLTDKAHAVKLELEPRASCGFSRRTRTSARRVKRCRWSTPAKPSRSGSTLVPRLAGSAAHGYRQARRERGTAVPSLASLRSRWSFANINKKRERRVDLSQGFGCCVEVVPGPLSLSVFSNENGSPDSQARAAVAARPPAIPTGSPCSQRAHPVKVHREGVG
jgi:hypothetical protein